MEQLPVFYITIAASIIIGLTAFSLWQLFGRRHQRYVIEELTKDVQQLKEELSDKQAITSTLQKTQQDFIRLQHEVSVLDEKKRRLAQLETQLEDLRAFHAEEKTRYESQIASFTTNEKANEEKLALLKEAENRMQTQFENLANKIFEQKSESFSKANKTGLESLLMPLKEQIEGFKKQVSDAYVKEGQERASLRTEILSLKELNQRITAEATALTNALKGDNKQQGNWGEVVLERILEESGLREGHEFDTQTALRSDEGKLFQPDVIVHLPNEKDIIIDSKVSLVSYEGYHAAENPEQKGQHVKAHVQSIRNHIKGLSQKDYQKLRGVRTLDYVLMFIPIEPAFLLAIEHDPELVNYALNQNIMLVSPTNLLVALRTINNIWQYEYQNQNAQQIAERAAKLYDKLSGFVGDMEKLGKSIDASGKVFDTALNKLTTGKGNILRQVENFKSMGVQPTKQLPKHLLDESE